MEDLFGERKEETMTQKKPAAAVTAAPKKAVKKAAVKKAATKKVVKKGERQRVPRGTGPLYLPKDGKDCKRLMENLVNRIKVPTIAKRYGQKYDIPTWKVRVAAVFAEQDGLLKTGKTAGAKGLLTILPKGFRGTPTFD